MGLSLSEELAFVVGHLVMSWAQCESVLFGFLACFVQGQQGQSQIVWLSTLSTRARTTYVHRLAASAGLPPELMLAIKQHLTQFHAVTRTRNMFCHARYEGDFRTGDLVALESYDLGDADEPVPFNTVRRDLNKGLVNEGIAAIERCNDLIAAMWPTLVAIRECTGAAHLTLPAGLPDFLASQGRS